MFITLYPETTPPIPFTGKGDGIMFIKKVSTGSLKSTTKGQKLPKRE
jgi:hypothetical protein